MKQKLPPKFKEKWVAALRSGKYKQGKDFLYNKDEDTYCCLGVACKVAGVGDNSLAGLATIKDYPVFSKLPRAIVGDDDVNAVVDFLTAINDGRKFYFASDPFTGKKVKGRKTFKGIATWIEKNL